MTKEELIIELRNFSASLACAAEYTSDAITSIRNMEHRIDEILEEIDEQTEAK